MTTNNIPFFKRRICKNQKKFLQMEKEILKEKNFSRKCDLAYEAGLFAVCHTTDVFSSEIIENVFLELAQKHSIPLAENFKKNTILHVMTEAYTEGGHTRCVERWIQQLDTYRHSCVILNQRKEFPKQLMGIVEKSGGELIRYDTMLSMLDKALKLRKYASEFEYVVLHTHMHEPIALIAFGTKDFKRPVVFFNHADHAFWLGVSVSDWIADLNTNRNKITLDYRGTSRASILGIPMDDSPLLTYEKADARRKLGLPLDKKIIFSAGQAKKYNPLGSVSFYEIIMDILSQNPSTLIYIAGADKTQIFWPKLLKKFPNNLFLTGNLDYKTVFPLYLSAADLVLDSFPVGGETFAIDAIKSKKPILTLNTTIQTDFLINSEGCCPSYEEFLKKVDKILNDSEYAESIYQNIYQGYIKETDPTLWKKRCQSLLENLPKCHQIYPFHRVIPKEITTCSLETTPWTEAIQKTKLGFILKKIRKGLIRIHLKKDKKLVQICGIILYQKIGANNDNKTRNNIF